MGDLHDVAAWVDASDVERAERLAFVARLEIAVIDGTATDDERDGYLILRAPFDAESNSRFRYYGGAAGLDFDNTHEFRATPLEMVTATNAGDWMVPDDFDDCAPGLETPGNASLCWVLTRPEVQAALRLRALADHDHDRPSPGDDTTHAAFDAMDRE